MKKHLAIICGIFYPNPSATGQCVKRFAELLSDRYEIDLICLSEDETTAEVDLGNTIRIHKLSGRRMATEARSHGVARRIMHFLGGIQIKTLLLGNLSWYRRAAYHKLEDIHVENALHGVFSICSPFAAHCAAMDFKRVHPAVHWCGYTVDPYATNNRIRPVGCSYEDLIEKERAVLCAMDTLLVSEEVYQHRPELYAGCRDCRILPYILPEFSQGNSERKLFSACDINCVYAGSFYQDIRNPECMLRTFAKINHPGIKLHLFSSGCERLVHAFSENSSNIIVHPSVSADEIGEVYREADVLVNIGNSTSEFMPSKIFEYIATGKPIVNFYFERCDWKVLGQYPLCLQLSNTQECEHSTDLENFLLQNGRKMVASGEIERIYSKHSHKRILEILCDAVME